MISFKQFLAEADPEEEYTSSDAAKAIFTHCKPFLNESGIITGSRKLNELSKLKGLWRGMIQFPGQFVKFEGHLEREPVDTDERIHGVLDAHLNKKFGFRYRSQGTFCSNRYQQARGYSPHVYLVFPIGKYWYVWSDKVPDAYVTFEESMGSRLDILRDLGLTLDDVYTKNRFDIDKWVPVLEEWLDQNSPYTDKDLKKALQYSSSIEIMLSAKEFYGLKINLLSEHSISYATNTLERLKEMIK